MLSKSKKKIIAVTFILTALFVFVGLNFLPGEKKIEHRIPRLYSTSDPQFNRSMGVLLGPPLVSGNQTKVLVNGDQIFPAMLEAIRSAKKTITFETYIYWSGKVGKDFTDALAERARAGVKVHVMMDWLGTNKMDNAYLAKMRAAGIQVERYHPLHWYSLSRLNNRTHRKLLVVDGKIGFTGGVGIADLWSGNAENEKHWRDTHFRIEGPAVAQMQAAFLDNWVKVTGMVLHGEDYFPFIPPAGNQSAQVFMSSPSGGSESMHLMYLLSVTAAAQTIELSSAYFVPDELTLRAMTEALKRGVRIRIIVPGKHTDSKIVRNASRAQWGGLLRAGTEIYEYQPTMFHCKVMVIDRQWVTVGSTNFDNRSFSLNDEANLNVSDTGFARQQIDLFEQDLKQSKRITWEAWLQRPWHERAFEYVATLLHSQL